MLGGNVSEQLVFGDTTTGSSNDIEKATGLARAMVTQYGMSERLGPLTFGKKDEMVFLGREISEQRNYSDEVAAKIDAEVREIIDRAYERAKQALTTHREVLDRLAALLIEKETIEGEEFESLFEGILPPRSGGPTQRPAETPAADEAPVTDAEPGAEEGGSRRRPGPAPQPA
jgi:cell division protease FtsH